MVTPSVYHGMQIIARENIKYLQLSSSAKSAEILAKVRKKCYSL
jgi:hypothetical protein